MRSSAIGPVTIPARFWSEPDVLQALESRDIGELFRLIRDGASLSQTRIGTATGFAQGRVSRITRGLSEVREVATLTRIADGLQMPAQARAALGLAPGAPGSDPDPAPEPARSASRAIAFSASYPASAPQAVETVTAMWRADLAHSSDLLSAPVHPPAWNAAALGWLTGASDTGLAGSGSGRAVGLADVARVRSSLALLADMDNRFGGAHAHRSLIYYLDGEAAALLAGRYTDETGRELFTAVAEATLLAAWTSYDCGFNGAAQRYFVQALRLAQAAGNRQLACSVLSAMSHQATYLGRCDEAASLARAACEGLRDQGTPALTAQFLAMEARALARAADARGCLAVLAAAERAFRVPEPGRDPEFISYFNEAEFTAEAAHCFRDLGDARQAAEHASRAVPSDGTYARSDFFITIVLADALADQGEAALACQTALDALRIGQTLTSARCVTYAQQFRRRLARFGDSPEIRDFASQAAGNALWIKAA
jgi:transcriptional regulator with XRE-family HTH domain/tetratricopeptide (TPR) repeat protein